MKDMKKRVENVHVQGVSRVEAPGWWVSTEGVCYVTEVRN
jgi:hypothetical protein